MSKKTLKYKIKEINNYLSSNDFETLVGIISGIIVGVPIGILVLIGIFILLPVWGKFIFGFILATPIIFYLKIYYDNHLKKSFFIDTEFGKGKCKLTNFRNKLCILIYLRKTIQVNNKRNFLNRIFEPKAKYSKLMVISGKEHSVIDTYNKMRETKTYDYNFIICNFLKINIADLHEKSAKININESNIAQLAQLPFMDKNKALKVILHIQKNGELNSIWEFAKLAELEQNQLDIILKRVYVEKTEIKYIETYEELKKELSDNNDPTLDIL